MSDLCLDTCPTHYTRNRYACQQKVLSLQQEACLPQGVQYPPVSVLTGAEQRVKVDAAGENGVYTFELKESSNEVVTYEVRALNTKDKQESETVEVQVGKIDATAPEVEVTSEPGKINTKYTVKISDSQSGSVSYTHLTLPTNSLV